MSDQQQILRSSPLQYNQRCDRCKWSPSCRPVALFVETDRDGATEILRGLEDTAKKLLHVYEQPNGEEIFLHWIQSPNPTDIARVVQKWPNHRLQHFITKNHLVEDIRVGKNKSLFTFFH